jgi:DNA-binding ferritin-like protein
MIELAILLRTLNLYSHHAHNVCSGNEFFQDHEFFKELYLFCEDSYDSIIERHIGTTNSDVNLSMILRESADTLSAIDGEYLKNCLIILKESTKFIEQLSKNDTLSCGTVNMIQGIADSMEVFMYKIKRRMK